MNININGKLISESEYIFSSSNRGFLYGDNIFQTILYSNKNLLFWEEHYFRLMGGATIMRMHIPQSLNLEYLYDEIMRTIDSCVLSNETCRVRISAFRSNGGYYLPTNNKMNYLIHVKKIEKKYLNILVGKKIDVFYDHFKPKYQLANFKGNFSIISTLSAIFADENKLDESIILNSSSEICETTSSNIFLIFKSDIVTPIIESGCVDGVVRKVLIDFLRNQGYNLIEREVKTFDLVKADEVFLTNSIKMLQWVSSYKNKNYNNVLFKEIQYLFMKKFNIR